MLKVGQKVFRDLGKEGIREFTVNYIGKKYFTIQSNCTSRSRYFILTRRNEHNYNDKVYISVKELEQEKKRDILAVETIKEFKKKYMMFSLSDMLVVKHILQKYK
jgi:hypothetical protein